MLLVTLVPLILDLQPGCQRWCWSPGGEQLGLLLHGCAVWRVGAAVEPRDAENEDFFATAALMLMSVILQSWTK